MEGAPTMPTKPAIRITRGDVAGPTGRVNVTLFGGHMDGLPVTQLEVPGVWPVITTLEPWPRKDVPPDSMSFIPRYYKVCQCFGKVVTDRRKRVRYCLQVESDEA